MNIQTFLLVGGNSSLTRTVYKREYYCIHVYNVKFYNKANILLRVMLIFIPFVKFNFGSIYILHLKLSNETNRFIH